MRLRGVPRGLSYSKEGRLVIQNDRKICTQTTQQHMKEESEYVKWIDTETGGRK